MCNTVEVTIEQRHNRPSQEFIDCYNKVKDNLFSYLELKKIDYDSPNRFQFVIPELSLTKVYEFENLDLVYVFKKLNRESPEFREWLKGKVNAMYERQLKFGYVYTE